MKPGIFLFAVCLASALVCSAQGNATAGRSGAQPDATSPDAVSALGSLFHKGKPKPAATAPAAATTSAPAPAAVTTSMTPDAAATAQPGAIPAAASDAGIYVIGPSDVIAVTVFKEPTLSNTLLVRPDGMISIPLLGDVEASGKTPGQLAEEITAKLKKYIQDPNVTVLLSGMNSKKVYMMGEVARIGPIELIPGMTLLQAIASAGGLSVYANSGKIYILRMENGQQQKIPVQYKQALKGDSALNLTLKAGDTIVVP
jgi:polysaccharide export outer membrane protein